jgi:O-antigen/teichoic acid export membrane protein
MRPIAGDAALLAAARLGSQALMVVFTGVVARRLGSEGLGDYSVLAAALFVANTVTTFGTDTLVIRSLSATRDWGLLPTAVAVQLALSTPVILAAVAAGGWVSSPLRVSPVTWGVFSLALIPMAFYGVLTAALRSFGQMLPYMLLVLAGALLQALGAVIALLRGGSVLTLAYLVLGVQVVSALLAALACRRRIPGLRFPLHVSWVDLRSAVMKSWRLGALGALMMLYQRQGVVVTAVLGGAALAGWFSAAARLVDAAKVAHHSLSGALLPVLGQAAHRTEGQAANRESTDSLRRPWSLLFVLSAVAAAALSVLARPLSVFFFGEGFGPTASALPLLAWSLLPFTVNTRYALSHVAEGRERPVLLALAMGALVLAALSSVSVPRWGTLGVCGSVLIAECSQTAVYLAHRFLARRPAPVVRLAGEV